MSRKCPHCGEQVGQTATTCWRCDGSLEDVYGAGTGGSGYRSPIVRERGGPTGRQKAFGWLCIAMGALVPVVMVIGIIVRGVPNMSLWAAILMPIVCIVLIIYGISILRSKTSNINLFRWDLGRK